MISRTAPVAQLRTNLSLSEFDLSTLYEFFVTPEKIDAACSLVNFGNAVSASVDRTKREPTFEIAPAFVLAVFRRLQILARYLKRTSPTAHNTVLKNASWVRTKF